MQWVKDLALSLQWLGSFRMQQLWPKNKTKQIQGVSSLQNTSCAMLVVSFLALSQGNLSVWLSHIEIDHCFWSCHPNLFVMKFLISLWLKGVRIHWKWFLRFIISLEVIQLWYSNCIIYSMLAEFILKVLSLKCLVTTYSLHRKQGIKAGYFLLTIFRIMNCFSSIISKGNFLVCF